MIETCIIKGSVDEPGDEPVILRRQFSTMPAELKEFALWLEENECLHVAMESTGVYWLPVYEEIEARGNYERILVANATHMRNLPGRKTDVKDAEWIATLLRHGLLPSSFIPGREIRNLRKASRMYKKIIGEKSRYVNRVEKLLQAHGFKLSSVLSDIMCVSGRDILRLLAERGSLTVYDIQKCLKRRTKHTADEIHEAASGSLNEAERAMLKLLLREIEDCERNIETILSIMTEIADPYQSQISLIDSVYGIDKKAALLILAEIGPAPWKEFSSAEKLCSWAGLSPRNDESAGKIKSRKILPGNPYVKSILCQVAWVAVYNRKSNFGQWFWSHQARIGKKKAIIAVSRKILTTIYIMLRDGTPYDPEYSCAG